jgi:hypothetical protein
MAQNQSQSKLTAGHESHDHDLAAPHADRPHKGEHFRCETCGMEIDVTAECQCEGEDGPHFECCGHELKKV